MAQRPHHQSDGLLYLIAVRYLASRPRFWPMPTPALIVSAVIVVILLGLVWNPSWNQAAANAVQQALFRPLNAVEAETSENGAINTYQESAITYSRVEAPLNAGTSDDPVVAAAGDIACGRATTNALCQDKQVADVIAQIKPDAVLPLGDTQYQYGQLEDYMLFYDKSWGRFKDISHPTVGNHEYQTPSARGYFTYFGDRAGYPGHGYYSFDLGGWHLISLNSNCQYIGCWPQSDQANWLKQDLSDHQAAACTLVIWHHPRFTSGFSMDTGQPVSDLFEILYQHQVDLLLSGHSHNYERFDLQNNAGQQDPQGIRQFVVGTGGKNFTKWNAIRPNSQARQNYASGVLKLTLHPKSYDWEFMSIVGQTYKDAGFNYPCHKSGESL